MPATAAPPAAPRAASATFTPLDELCVNTIRTLSMDAVQKANSGHPGAPMGLAPLAYTLWQRFLRYNPENPAWSGRDRFVLSNGHASMLLYSLLHLAGVGEDCGKKPVTLDEIKRFRQLDSVTPGHPESHVTAGVETTTGPLGQGFGNAVGMALAHKWLAATYSRPGFEALFGQRVYCICGDGCMMEGVTSEASSLAGHLQLDNLVVLYDDNSITIDGRTSLAFTEDVAGRFDAYGWRVLHVADGNDMPAIERAVAEASELTRKPTLVVVKTVIGYGAPNRQDTNEAHGSPLGADEIKLTKKFYGWPEDAQFLVPDGVYDHFREGIGARGRQAQADWDALFARYEQAHPDLARQMRQMDTRELPEGWEASIPVFPPDPKGLASRESSGKVLSAVGEVIPWLIGGSADLAKSNNSKMTFKSAGEFQAATPAGRNINFGVREHAMGAMVNGMSLTKVRPYCAGFLIFSDYMRNPIRLAALEEIPVLYLFTHDSIGVGEDGPTHQPIEQLVNLRAVPNLVLIRPADANEVAEAYRYALRETHLPVALALSRQALPTLDRTKYASAAGLHKGAYVLADAVPGSTPEVILIATGSEVPLCLEAFDKLKADGVKVRLVSLPSWDLFQKQDREYQLSVIPKSVKARVCVEMSSTFGWERYAGDGGHIIGMHSWGASAPLKDLMKHYGFTVDAIVKAAKEQVAMHGGR